VTYRRPLLEGVAVRAEGWYVRRQGKMVLGAGRVIDAQGRVLATARGRFLPLGDQQIARFVGADGE
jgi:acyl-coenzyme A thioesterase PaaI-like protein